MIRTTLRSAMAIVTTGFTLAAELPMGHPDFMPTPERPVGWRGGTGCGWYPGAKGVVPAWSDASMSNIVWRVQLPFLSAASPIVAGDKLFTTAEPDELICMDARTGKVLWQRSNNPILEKKTESQAQRARATHAKFVRLSREWSYEGNPVECDYAFPKSKTAIPAKVTSWLASHAELLAELGLTGTDLVQMASGFYKERDACARDHGLIPPDRWALWFGGCMPTPVSDGQYVYNKYASGALVKYDLDGNRQWMTDRGLRLGHGEVASLALAEGMLLDHGKNDMLTAYDAATGKQAWSIKAAKGEWAAASPIAVQVGGTWVLLTGGGDMVRVRDGEKLLSRQWNSFTGSSPIFHDGVLYACNMAQGVEGSIGAVRLSTDASGKFCTETLWWWTKWWRGNKGFTSTQGFAIDEPMPGAGRGSPAYADGTVFFVGGTGGLELTVVNAKTGQCIPQGAKRVKNVIFSSTRGEERKKLGITLGREACISATVADGYLFIGYSAVPRSLFVTFRILQGGTVQEVARSTVEGLTVGTPFFQGDRMYVRTFDYMYCIGKTAQP